MFQKCSLSLFTDIRAIFLVEYEFGNNTAKAAGNINRVFGRAKNYVNDQKVQCWFKKFWTGDFFRQNKSCGKPKMKALVETNQTVSKRELASRIDDTTILQLSEIGKLKKMDNWIMQEVSK